MATLALDVRLHRRTLDRDLAVGIGTWRSPQHAARACQLTSRRHRRRLADALDHVIDVAVTPSLHAYAAIPLCRSSVSAAAPQIARLTTRLRSDEPIAAAGVVRLEALLSDGAGPLYAPGPPADLIVALTRVNRWLDVGE
jgi:hypothetical protein